MRRIFLLIAAVICLDTAPGCGGLGWYRAAGDIPGVAPTDYAFYNFFGTSFQLYPFSPPQVESSALEALGDLGFTVIEPPTHLPSGEIIIRTRTPDGRPAKLKIAPQNSLTSVKVQIGPGPCGDEQLSRDLLRRIAANFGTAMRVYTPIDMTLPKRWNAPSGFVPQAEHTPPLELKGEGLRPNESRDQAAAAAASAASVAAQEAEAAAGASPGGRASTPGSIVVPNPYLPYVPFPFPMTNPDNQ